jgi:MFS family permease
MSAEARPADHTEESLMTMQNAVVGTMRASLRYPAFRCLAVGLAVSQLGDWLYNLALVAVVYQRTHSALWAGVTTAARVVPIVALGPLGGALADRFDRRRLMVACDLIRLALMVALALFALARLPMVLAPLIAAAATTAAAPYLPAVSAVTPRLVSDADLPGANAARSAITSVALIAGPALGGVLLLLGSPVLAFGVNAATFGLSALAVLAIPAGEAFRPGGSAQHRGGLLRGLADGAVALRSRPQLLRLVGANFMTTLTYGMQTVLLILVARRAGLGLHGYGYLFAAIGVGALAGTALGRRALRCPYPRAVLLTALAAVGLPMSLLAVVRWPAVAIVLVAVTGIGAVVVDILTETGLQRMLPSEVFGSAYGLGMTFCMGAIVLGSLIAPLLTSVLGGTGALIACGAAATGYALLSLRPQPSGAAQPRAIFRTRAVPDSTSPKEPLGWAGSTDRIAEAGREPMGAGGRASRAGSRLWRSPASIFGASAVALLAAFGAYGLAGHVSGRRGDGGVASLAVPSCSTAIAGVPTLTSVTSAASTTSGSPFGLVGTPDGRYVFVSIGNAVALLRTAGPLAPTFVRTIPASHANRGAALTHDGRFLVAAAGSGAVVINVAQAEQGVPGPVVGTLTSPDGKAAARVLISGNDQFAFVTLQNSAEVAVFNLGRAVSRGFSSSDFVGYVHVGQGPVAMASDGTWLYVTSLSGTLSIVSVSKAETSPASAVVGTVAAGCQPYDALLAGNQKVLWVTARGSDALLGFSTAMLRADPRHALIARVMVGEMPLGEIFVAGGSRIIIADSNLDGLPTATANLAVVNVPAALAGKPALLGYVPTGLVPRLLAILHGGKTLLVTDEKSHQIQAVAVADLLCPRPASAAHQPCGT